MVIKEHTGSKIIANLHINISKPMFMNKIYQLTETLL